MGMEVKMTPGKGPTIDETIDTPEDIDKLKTTLTDELDYFYDSLFLVRHRLNGVAPLFGFCVGPFTLICFMIEGSSPKSFTKIKRWMYVWPEDFKRLIDMLTEVLIIFLMNQIKAGAQLLQVFESFIGELSPWEFNTFFLPALTKLSNDVKNAFPDVPLILFPRRCHFCNKSVAQNTSFDGISLDTKQSISEVRQDAGTLLLQGNLEPCVLFGTDQ